MIPFPAAAMPSIIGERTRVPAYGHTVPVTKERSTGAVWADEERMWTELHALVGAFPQDKFDQPGYFQEGWSAMDLIAHIGSWLAEAGVVLQRMRFGTYRPEEVDIDPMNQAFYDAMHDVRSRSCGHKGSQLGNRMLRAWRSLPEESPEAETWIRKAGPDHYAEHPPWLGEWVSELAG